MQALTGQEVEPTLIMRGRPRRGPLPAVLPTACPIRSATKPSWSAQDPDVADSADRLIELALRGGGRTTSPWWSRTSSTTTTGPDQPIIAGRSPVTMTTASHHPTPPQAALRRSRPVSPLLNPSYPSRAAVETAVPQTDVHRRRPGGCWPDRVRSSATGSSAATTTSAPTTTGPWPSCAVSRGSILGVPCRSPTCSVASTTAASCRRSVTGGPTSDLDCDLMRLDDLRPPSVPRCRPVYPPGTSTTPSVRFANWPQFPASAVHPTPAARTTPQPTSAPRTIPGAPTTPLRRYRRRRPHDHHATTTTHYRAVGHRWRPPRRRPQPAPTAPSPRAAEAGHRLPGGRMRRGKAGVERRGGHRSPVAGTDHPHRCRRAATPNSACCASRPSSPGSPC